MQQKNIPAAQRQSLVILSGWEKGRQYSILGNASLPIKQGEEPHPMQQRLKNKLFASFFKKV